MIIKLIDGPLKGNSCEISIGFPEFYKFALPEGDNKHWYQTLYCRTKAIFIETEHETFQYSRHIDPIIYRSCLTFNKNQFLDLAIAALDQCSVDKPEVIAIMRLISQYKSL